MNAAISVLVLNRAIALLVSENDRLARLANLNEPAIGSSGVESYRKDGFPLSDRISNERLRAASLADFRELRHRLEQVEPDLIASERSRKGLEQEVANARSEFSLKCTELEHVRDRVVILNSEVKRMEALTDESRLALERVSRERDESNRNLQRQQDALLESERARVLTQESLNRVSAELKEATVLSGVKERRLEEIQRQVGKMDHTREHLATRFEDLERENAHYRAALEEQSDRCVRMGQALKERDSELGRVQDVLADLRREREVMRSKLDQEAAVHAKVQVQNEDLFKQVNSLKKSLFDTQNQSIHVTEMVKDETRSAKILQERLGQLESERDQLYAEVEFLRDEAASRALDVQKLMKDNQSLESELRWAFADRNGIRAEVNGLERRFFSYEEEFRPQFSSHETGGSARSEDDSHGSEFGVSVVSSSVSLPSSARADTAVRGVEMSSMGAIDSELRAYQATLPVSKDGKFVTKQ